MKELGSRCVRACAFVVVLMAASPSFAQISKLLPKVHLAPAESYDQTHCLVFSPDGGKLLVCNNNGPVDILKLPLGQRLGGFFAKKFLAGLVFSPDGMVVAGYCRHREGVFLLDTERWEPAGAIPTPNLGVMSIAFSPDGRYLAAVCEGPTDITNHGGGPPSLLIWDFPSRKLVREMRWSEHDGLPIMQFSPDSKTLVTALKAITFWNVKTGTRIRTITNAHADKLDGLMVDRLAFLSGGANLASAGMDRRDNVTIKTWSVATGKLLQTLRGHDNGMFVNSLIPLPGEKLISSSACDGTFRLWDLRTAREIAQFDTGANVDCPTLSPNGEILVCNLMTRDLRIWKLSEVFPMLRANRKQENQAN